MTESPHKKAVRCCSIEKQRLVKEIRECDFCSETYEDLHQCYRSAARDSGQQARACVMG